MRRPPHLCSLGQRQVRANVRERLHLLEDVMTRISAWAWVLCAGLICSGWAQIQRPSPLGSGPSNLHNRAISNLSTVTTGNMSFSPIAGIERQNSVSYLGHYPGGSWAEPRDINNQGLVVGFGDIATGFTRPLSVQSSGM